MNLLIILSSFHDSNGVQELANSLRPNGGLGYRSLPQELAREAGEFKGGRSLHWTSCDGARGRLASPRSNPRRGTPHDRRVSHLYLAAGLGRDRRGTLWPGPAEPHQAVAARRLLAHRGRPVEPDHPCVALREFRGAHPDPPP